MRWSESWVWCVWIGCRAGTRKAKIWVSWGILLRTKRPRHSFPQNITFNSNYVGTVAISAHPNALSSAGVGINQSLNQTRAHAHTLVFFSLTDWLSYSGVWKIRQEDLPGHVTRKKYSTVKQFLTSSRGTSLSFISRCMYILVVQ